MKRANALTFHLNRFASSYIYAMRRLAPPPNGIITHLSCETFRYERECHISDPEKSGSESACWTGKAIPPGTDTFGHNPDKRPVHLPCTHQISYGITGRARKDAVPFCIVACDLEVSRAGQFSACSPLPVLGPFSSESISETGGATSVQRLRCCACNGYPSSGMPGIRRSARRGLAKKW